MTELQIHGIILGLILLSGTASAFILLFISAPYGRHGRPGWGPTLPSRMGWVLMELPAVALFVAIYVYGSHRWSAVPLLLCALWQFHYVYRVFIYPFRIRTPSKPMPFVIMGIAFLFQCANSYVNARWISELGPTHDAVLLSPHVGIGLALFVLGWSINQHSDHILLNLRKPGETGYKIPRGGVFRWVTCPNYLGELMSWVGWAVICWSWAGWSFAFFTAANLIPRALRHHQWMQEKFDDYPNERKAVIPFLL